MVPSFFSSCANVMGFYLASSQVRNNASPGKTCIHIAMYQCVDAFFYICTLSPVLVGLFSSSRQRGTQGARLYTTVQVWVPGGLRGACSGHSKSRNLARKDGVAFGGASAEQDNGKPTCQLFCSTAVKALYLVAATVQEQSHINFVWTTIMRVWTLHTRVCSVCAACTCA